MRTRTLMKGDLRIRGVSKSYGEVRAVRDVSLDVPPGQFVTLLGPSGCGKTTLLRMIAGLDAPSGGQILIDGVEHGARGCILVLDKDLRVTTANAAYLDMFGVSAKETVGNLLYHLGNGQWGIPRLRALLHELLQLRQRLRMPGALDGLFRDLLHLQVGPFQLFGQAGILLGEVLDRFLERLDPRLLRVDLGRRHRRGA